MRSENGIPRPFTPAQFRQEFNDFKRYVEARLSARNYVSVERIVEGGTINENVGKQLTETVQETIVIDRQNLAEAALTDVVVTGSITTRGQTPESPPRPIDVSLTTFSRNLNGVATDNAGIVFVVEGQDEAFAPGVYSPDGRNLVLATADGTGAMSYLQLGAVTGLVSPEFVVGPYLAPLFNTNSTTNTVTLGRPNSIFSPGPADVNLLGNVKVNGNLLDVQHAEFTTTFSLPTGTTNRKPTTPFTPDQTTTKNGSYATPAEAGAITLTAGVYAITYRADCGAPMGTQGRIAILNSDETRTHINMPIPNEWDGTLTTPNLYLPTTQKIVFTVKQTSGTTLNCNIRVAIEKIK